jgi:ankyrin repeat protein
LQHHPEVIIILGPGVNKYHNLARYFQHPNITTIGDGINQISLKLIEELDYLDSGSKVLLNFHGNYTEHNNMKFHSIYLNEDKTTYTAELFDSLAYLSGGKPLNVGLSACYSAIAKFDVDLLPKGSVLFTTDGLEKVSYTDLVSNYFYENILTSDNFFQDFLNHFPSNIANGGTFSVSHFDKTLTFKYNLGQVLLYPKIILEVAQEVFIEYYQGLYKEAKASGYHHFLSHWGNGKLTAMDFTDSDAKFFRQAYFLYACNHKIYPEASILKALTDLNDKDVIYELMQGIKNVYPLHLLVASGYEELIDYLLPYIGDINKIYYGVGTALYFAAKSDHINLVEKFLNLGADPDLRATSSYKTPLIAAVANDNYEVTELLIARGADINATTLSGNSALHFAVTDNNLAMVNLLIEGGIYLNQTTVLAGETPLYTACQNGYTDIALALIKAGADLDYTTTLENYSALMIAVENNHYEIAQALILAGSDEEIINNYGYTAAMLADKNGYEIYIDAIDHYPYLMDYAINLDESVLIEDLTTSIA